MATIKATNIQWDLEEEDVEAGVELADEMIIPDDIIANCEYDEELADIISDYITDETGFCHKGFQIEIVKE